MGPDFNGDGKSDWRDDAFFHNVINSDTKSDDSKAPIVGNGRKTTKPQIQNQPQTNNTESNSLGGVVLIVVIVLILILLFFS